MEIFTNITQNITTIEIIKRFNRSLYVILIREKTTKRLRTRNKINQTNLIWRVYFIHTKKKT